MSTALDIHGQDKDRCPICGDVIEDIREGLVNVCENGHGPFTPNELLTEEDDYAWTV